MERMNRRWKRLSVEDVQSLIDRSSPEDYSNGGLANGEYMPPFAESLIGSSFTFGFEDYPDCHYVFSDLHTLHWKQEKASQEEFYQAHEIEQGVFFVQHMLNGSIPPQCRTLVFDTNTGLITLCHAQFGNGIEAREVSHSFHFGKIEGYSSYPEQLHYFTSDLVGNAIYWTYHKDLPPVKHIYSSEYYYSYAMQFGDKCWMASNPADYIKISDHLYIFSFIEERQAGTQGFFLINMYTLHDVGSFLGINSNDQFECYTVGAKGELTTMYTRWNT